jgi:hypothetical protein
MAGRVHDHALPCVLIAGGTMRLPEGHRAILDIVCNLLDSVMAQEHAERSRASVLDAVALLTDHPGEGLARGQVGTVVESLDHQTVLVEFSDDDGRAYAIAPCRRAELLVLHYEPEAA